MPPLMLLQLLLMLMLCAPPDGNATCQSSKETFHPITGVDCVSPSFTKTIHGSCDLLSCSLHCATLPLCRAFTLPLGACLCKLFLFDKCSHRVQSEANCTHLVTVYVRSLPGVAAGRLCPPGYGFTRFGTSYKVSGSRAVNWTYALAKCSQEAGLSKFADALDPEESRHLKLINTELSVGDENFFIGGYQMAGSASKTEGWIWDACNASIRADVWEPERPNDGLPSDGCANVYTKHNSGIDDTKCNERSRYICECLSVF